MEAMPIEVKKDYLLFFLTPRQRVALSLTCKETAGWMRPILAFMSLPIGDKVALLRRGSDELTNGVILEALAQYHDPLALLSLLDDLPDRVRALKEGIRKIVEDRIRDRSYRKLIKKTLVRMYLEHLDRHNECAVCFIDTIRSPEVLSQAIEQHVLLQKGKMPRETLEAWVVRIPDKHTRDRVLHCV